MEAKLLPQIGRGHGFKLEGCLYRRQVASGSPTLEVNNVDSRPMEEIRFRLALTNGDDPYGIRCVLHPGRQEPLFNTEVPCAALSFAPRCWSWAFRTEAHINRDPVCSSQPSHQPGGPWMHCDYGKHSAPSMTFSLKSQRQGWLQVLFYLNTGIRSFGAFQNRPMPAKQNQSTPHVIKIGT